MPRIPDDELARLKAEVSLQRLVEADGIELKPHGADLVGRCPFHDDKTPSLVITPKTNLYHCFGCGAAGSVVDWVMARKSVSFREAVDELRDMIGLGEPATSEISADTSDPALLKRVVAFYHKTLKASPEALAYLEKRGLSNPELIDRFQLGYANRSLGQRLPPKQVKAGAEIRGRLQDVGILRDSGHEHFNGSVVIPLLDENKDVVEMYGRKIGERLRKGTPLHLYLPGPHRGVFNREALAASKEIILCESIIDALTFWSAGFRNVTCAYGVEGFTDELMAEFEEHGTKRVLIAYDRDDAGNRAAEKLAKRLMEQGIECFRVLFPKGMDANDFAVQMSPAEKALGLVLRKAEWMGSGEAPTTTQTDSSHLVAEPPATPAPESPRIDAEVSEREVVLVFGGEEGRRYRMRGLAKNTSYETLKVNVLVTSGDAMHVDTLDLYHARQRGAYIRQAAIELGLTDDAVKGDLAKVLVKLEQLQEQQIQGALEPAKDEPKPISSSEHDEAMGLLRSSNLMDRIVADVERCGLVGESTNVLMGYLAAVSRKLDQPLAIIIQSTSAAGKSALMDTVLELVPEEERVHFSAMTGQSLFYMGEGNLKHKILAIAEEEGVRQAAYALKLLQSQGALTIASTGKDETTGDLITKEYRVEGPVMLFLTTTAVDIDEELMNRCVVLTVNESREQTRRIHVQQRQARTLEGLLAAADSSKTIQTHRNAQRLLRPLKVVNPFAEQLTFLDQKTRTRRDHQKYLGLIDAIALLHQHQRQVHRIDHAGDVIEYVEATLDDIAVANRLAHDVLGRSLDELPPQTRRLLRLVQRMVIDQCGRQAIAQRDLRFSRREIREFTGWSDGQLKIHCRRLEDLEYLLVHRGGRGKSIAYELAYDGSGDTSKHLIGLLDLEKLGYDAEKSGQSVQKAGPSQAQVSPKSGPSQTGKNGVTACIDDEKSESALILPKTNGSGQHSVAT